MEMKTPPRPSFLGLQVTVIIAFTTILILTITIVFSGVIVAASPESANLVPTVTSTPTLTPTPTFDPALNAPLPDHRLVLFYGIPGAPTVGPAYAPTQQLLTQMQQYAKIWNAADPSKPVMLGLDLVVDVADVFPGPGGTYSHLVDPGTIQSFIDFCGQNNLLLFLDLQFGRSPVKTIVTEMEPYLEKYPFVSIAIDTEFHFPPNYGVPDYNLGWVDASDINWTIQTLHTIVAQYHVPRKVLIVHQWNPAVITNKSKIITDPYVSLVLHSDGFGTPQEKLADYQLFVTQQLLQYGGLKLFFNLDTVLLTPQQVLSTYTPAPLVISYQ